MKKCNLAIYVAIIIATAGCGGDISTPISTHPSSNSEVMPIAGDAPPSLRAFKQFSAASAAIGEDTTEGQVFRIYQAAFDRVADAGGLQAWIDYMKSGRTLEQVSAGFTGSQEFKDLYGASATHEQFVTRLYANVLHRVPDEGGFRA